MIFVAKFLAAFIVVMASQLLALGLGVLLLSLNPQSMDGLFYPDVFFKNVLRDTVFIFTGLAYGVFLSCFRLLGMLVFFVYLAVLFWWEVRFGGAGLISHFSILRVDFYANTLLLPWRAFAVQTSISLVLLIIACHFWSRDARRAGERDRSTRWTRRFIGVGSVVVFVFLALVMAFVAGFGLDDPRLSSSDEKFETTETAHYRFVSRRSDQPRVDFMREYADQDYQLLMAKLDAKDVGLLQTDLTADTRHVAGLAIGKRLQLDISGFEPDTWFRRVLSHETVHVFQSSESDNRLRRYSAATHFFIEGMAQYLSFSIVDDTGAREKNWQLAAVARKKQGIEFDDILDHNEFSRRHDSELAYSLGDTWVSALVDVCGEQVLGEFLRQVGVTTSSPGVSARQFWNENLSAIGCNLSSVGDHWRQTLESLSTSTIPGLFPDIVGVDVWRDNKAVGSADTLTVKVTLDGDHPETIPEDFYLKIRAASTLVSAPNRVFNGQQLDADPLTAQFTVPVSQAPSGILEFQAGYVPKTGGRAYYAPWRRSKVLAQPP